MRIIIALLLIALLMPKGFAQDAGEDAGVLPDSPLYGLDRALERVSLALSAGNPGKAEKRLKRASERLAELAAMVEKGNNDHNTELLNDHRNEVELAEEAILSEKDAGRNVEELEKMIAEATYKHVLVLEQVMANAPLAAQDGLRNAIQASTKENQRALSRFERATGQAAEASIDLAQRRRGRA